MNNVELLKMLNDVDERFLTEEYQPTLDKRYKKDSKKQNDKIKKIDNMLSYFNDKQITINTMIKKIENDDIKNVSIDFL